MTDSIDLDEIETDSGSEEAETPNRGDWFWRGEGDPVDEAEPSDVPVEKDAVEARSTGGETSPNATPHVPHENRNKPVGLPTEQGGAGGVSAREAAAAGTQTSAPEASGPHGGGADEMTMAFTYRAARRLADPGFVFAGAAWADWVGIVGEVDAHVLNKFQRENGVDADFFNGSGTGPAERLAEITEMSMFFAERMVLVGTADEEWIAEEAGWEFVPLETAAEKAGWELD